MRELLLGAVAFLVVACGELATLATPEDVRMSAGAFLSASRVGDTSAVRVLTARETANQEAYPTLIVALGDSLRAWGQPQKLIRYSLHFETNRPNAHRVEYVVGPDRGKGRVILWIERENEGYRVETYQWYGIR